MFTALIGPHFVDWTSYRESFEREASGYIGRPVEIAGKAHVRLLPTPVISFTDIRVGDAAAPDVEIEQFRAEIELTPLLRGDIRIIQMTVERPRFHLDIAKLATDAEGPAGWQVAGERIALEDLRLVDGSALIRDARTGRSWHAEGIDATIEAETLRGPGRVTAAMEVDGNPVDLNVVLGRVTGEAIAAKISVRTPAYPVTLALDGTYHFPGERPAMFDGIATVEGIAPENGSAPRSPWADFRASGKVELTSSKLGLDEMQISYGAMERPLILEASGDLDFGDEPRFDALIAARQVDLDRTLGGGAEAPVSIETALAALADALPRARLPPIHGTLRLEAQGVVLGGGVVQAVGVDLATSAGAWRVENLSALLPGDTRLDLDGMLGIDPTPAFRGHVRLASRLPPAFAAWWRGETGNAGRIGRFEIDTDLDFTTDDQSLSNLVATTGAGTVKGSVEMRRFPQTGRLFINVDLAADRADLVETRALAELFAGDMAGPGAIEQMTLALRADVLSAGGVEAQSVAVEGGLEAGQLNLRRFSVADLAGATVDALGSIHDPLGKPSGNIEASITAADFTGAANFIASLAPESAIAQHLKSVAPILSPVKAEVSAESGGAGERLALSLTGSFADTHLTLEADGKGTLDNLATVGGKLTLHADGEDSAAVLRQLGLQPLPVRSTPLRIEAGFEGELAAGTMTANGTIAGMDIDYAAETRVVDGHLTLSGPIKATSADLDPLLLLGGVAVLGVGEGHSASVAGSLEYSADGARLTLGEASFTGQPVRGTLAAKFSPEIEFSGDLELQSASIPFLASLATGVEPGLAAEGWPDTTFSAAIPANVALDFTLAAKTLDIGAPLPATDARLEFSISDSKLDFDLLNAGFAGGTLSGALAVTLGNGEAEVSLSGGLAGGDLQALVWEESGLPAASGKLDLSLEARGRGRSMSGIVASLVGSGSFSIEEGRLNALNGGALAAVMAAAEEEAEPDESAARETFAQLFGSGALSFGRAAGGFSLDGGVATIPTVSLADSTTTILADARLDLNALTLASEWVVRAVGTADEAAQPSVEVRFSGPIAEPERRIDLDPLLERLHGRFQQRQLDQIEALEAQRRQETEERRSVAAERRDRDATEGLAVVPMALSEEPDPAPTSAPVEPAPPSWPDPAAIEIGPDLPPPAAAAPVRPSVPVRRSQRLNRSPAPQPIPLPPPAGPSPSQDFDYNYRVLPNGTIVKIR